MSLIIIKYIKAGSIKNYLFTKRKEIIKSLYFKNYTRSEYRV
jgi:hypothetical protein